MKKLLILLALSVPVLVTATLIWSFIKDFPDICGSAFGNGIQYPIVPESIEKARRQQAEYRQNNTGDKDLRELSDEFLELLEALQELLKKEELTGVADVSGLIKKRDDINSRLNKIRWGTEVPSDPQSNAQIAHEKQFHKKFSRAKNTFKSYAEFLKETETILKKIKIIVQLKNEKGSKSELEFWTNCKALHNDLRTFYGVTDDDTDIDRRDVVFKFFTEHSIFNKIGRWGQKTEEIINTKTIEDLLKLLDSVDDTFPPVVLHSVETQLKSFHPCNEKSIDELEKIFPTLEKTLEKLHNFKKYEGVAQTLRDILDKKKALRDIFIRITERLKSNFSSNELRALQKEINVSIEQYKNDHLQELGVSIGKILKIIERPSILQGDAIFKDDSEIKSLVQELSNLEIPVELKPYWSAIRDDLASLVESRKNLDTVKTRGELKKIRDTFSKSSSRIEITRLIREKEIERMDYLLAEHCYIIPHFTNDKKLETQYSELSPGDRPGWGIKILSLYDYEVKEVSVSTSGHRTTPKKEKGKPDGYFKNWPGKKSDGSVLLETTGEIEFTWTFGEALQMTALFEDTSAKKFVVCHFWRFEGRDVLQDLVKSIKLRSGHKDFSLENLGFPYPWFETYSEISLPDAPKVVTGKTIEETIEDIDRVRNAHGL